MPPPKISTAELLAAVATGDREALEAAYRAHSARLFGVAMAILRDRPAAADALQEAFIRIWQRARRYEPTRGDADAWLAGVVRHAALDIARSRGREAVSDGGWEPAVDPDALDALAATEPGARLRDSLRRLEPKSRAAVVLGFVHGLSYGELSSRVNEPAGRARTIARRGLVSIRENLS